MASRKPIFGSSSTQRWPPLSTSAPPANSFIPPSPEPSPHAPRPPRPPGASPPPSPSPPPTSPPLPSAIPGVPAGLNVMTAEEVARRATLVPRHSRPPLVHLVVLLATDPRLTRYAHDVQLLLHRASPPCDVFLQTDTPAPASAPITLESLPGILAASRAEALVLITERDLRARTLQCVSLHSRLETIPLDEAIATLPTRLASSARATPPSGVNSIAGDANPNLFTPDRAEALLVECGCTSLREGWLLEVDSMETIVRLAREEWSTAENVKRRGLRSLQRELGVRNAAMVGGRGRMEGSRGLFPRVLSVMWRLIDIHSGIVEAYGTLRGLPAATRPGSPLPSEAVRRALLCLVNESISRVEASAERLDEVLSDMNDDVGEATTSSRRGGALAVAGKRVWLRYAEEVKRLLRDEKLGVATRLTERGEQWNCMHCLSWSEEPKIVCDACKCRRQRSALEVFERHFPVSDERRSEIIRAEIAAVANQTNMTQQMAALKVSASCGVYVAPTFAVSSMQRTNSKRAILPTPPSMSKPRFSSPAPPQPMYKQPSELESVLRHSFSTNNLPEIDPDDEGVNRGPSSPWPIPIGSGRARPVPGSLLSAPSPRVLSSSAPSDAWMSRLAPRSPNLWSSSSLTDSDLQLPQRDTPTPPLGMSRFDDVAVGSSGPIPFESMDSLTALAAASDAASGGVGSPTPLSMAKVSASLRELANSGSWGRPTPEDPSPESRDHRREYRPPQSDDSSSDKQDGHGQYSIW